MGIHKSKISKCLDLFDWDYALRHHSHEDIEVLLGVNRYTIEVAATSFFKRKILEKRQLNKVETPLHLISENDLKCNNAWNELKETQLYKQLNVII